MASMLMILALISASAAKSQKLNPAALQLLRRAAQSKPTAMSTSLLLKKISTSGDVNITSAKNTNTSSSDSKSSSGSIGVSINTSGISDINAGYSKYKGEVKENGTTHTNSTVSSNKIIGKEISALVNQCMFFCN